MKNPGWPAVCALLFLAGCGGGASAPPKTGPAPRSGMGTIKFSIVIPNQTTSPLTRHSQYISSNTHSMSLVVNGGTAQIFGLTPSTNADCSVSAGVTTCSNLSAAAPFGTDTLTFSMYQDSTPLPASPTLLSVTTVSNEVVLEGVANQLGTFTLNPVLATIAMAVSVPSGGFSAGTASSGNAINISAKDPSGATILGAGSYVDGSGTLTPIGLTSTHSQFTFQVDGASAISSGSLSGSSDTATLSYDGTSVSSATTITAAAGSLTPATQSISAVTAPIVATLSSAASGSDYHVVTSPPELDFYTTGITGSVVLSETGYAGTFTLQSDTCNTTDSGSATGDYATFAPALHQTGTTFTVSALAAGTSAHPAICTATFGDTNGQTLSVTFSVTTISFGLQ